ncbi:hypothetical protein PanWU01x14_175230, partial [Parasponia andersonii]
PPVLAPCASSLGRRLAAPALGVGLTSLQLLTTSIIRLSEFLSCQKTREAARGVSVLSDYSAHLLT